MKERAEDREIAKKERAEDREIAKKDREEDRELLKKLFDNLISSLQLLDNPKTLVDPDIVR